MFARLSCAGLLVHEIVRTQATMFAQVDRLFKQAIVDKDSFTVSCALVSGIQLFNLAPDVIRRWVNEVQESVNNKTKMTQFHALNLLHLIRRHDKLAINKVVREGLVRWVYILASGAIIIAAQSVSSSHVVYLRAGMCACARPSPFDFIAPTRWYRWPGSLPSLP
jgi:hypothetical protein